MTDIQYPDAWYLARARRLGLVCPEIPSDEDKARIAAAELAPRESAAVTACEWRGAFTLQADTSFGAPGPLGATSTCTTSARYVTLIRRRYRLNPAARQQLLVLSRRFEGDPRHPSFSIAGPYAVEARRVLCSLRQATRGEAAPGAVRPERLSKGRVG